MRLVRLEEVVGSRENVIYTGPAGVNQQCRRDSTARRHAAEDKALLDVLAIPIPGGNPGGLLGGVIDQPSHLLRVQPGGARSGCGSAEDSSDTVRALMCLEYSRTQSG